MSEFKSRKHNKESLYQLAKKRGWEFLSLEYRGGNVHHDFKCNKGHEIKKTVDNFLRGANCAVCSDKARLTISDFQLQAKKNNWELLSNTYSGKTELLKFRCLKCLNEFTHMSSYLRGNKKTKNCPYCSPLRKKTIEEIKKNAEKRGIECLSNEYHGIVNKLKWRCKYNHEWQASPNDIFNSNSGCPECKRFKTEAKIKHVFESYFEGFKFPKKSKIKTDFGFNIELDGFNEELSIAFEYNGVQHYEYSSYFHQNKPERFEAQKQRDEVKIQYCINNKISLVIIPYFISDDIDLAEHIIKSLPSKVEKNKDKIIKILINYGRDSDELKPIRDKLASIEMKLLSNTYSGVNDKNQLIKCLKCNHEYITSHNLIKRMVTCRNCASNKTFTIPDLKKIAENNNIILVSTEYRPQSKVEWQCKNGHKWKASPTAIKGTKSRKGTNCPICFGKNKITLEDVKNLALSRGHICLSKVIESRDSILKFECHKKEGEIHIWNTSYNSYKNSRNGCRYCTGKEKYSK